MFSLQPLRMLGGCFAALHFHICPNQKMCRWRTMERIKVHIPECIEIDWHTCWGQARLEGTRIPIWVLRGYATDKEAFRHGYGTWLRRKEVEIIRNLTHSQLTAIGIREKKEQLRIPGEYAKLHDMKADKSDRVIKSWGDLSKFYREQFECWAEQERRWEEAREFCHQKVQEIIKRKASDRNGNRVNEQD